MNRRTASTLVVLVSMAGLTLASAPSASAGIKLGVLSSQAENVTGGDTLIAATATNGTKPSKIVIRRNGTAVTGSFKVDPDNPNKLRGLVSGLRSGSNLISAWAVGLNGPTDLRVYNSSITGPVFSGPHQTPFYCTTDKEGLGPATDADCSAPTKVEYFYHATNGDFKPLASPTDRPPDLTQTTTSTGQTVDYVVRVESGTINRAVYRWAMLASGGVTGNGWNHRLIMYNGGGCSTGYQQGASSNNQVLDDRELSRGYTTVTSTLNIFATACNDVLSAETSSMVKEHVIKSMGEAPYWTIGEGPSGGSIQTQMTGQNYPGLYDGLLPIQSFPDNSQPSQPDCRLLTSYFATSALTEAQQEAIVGMDNLQTCLIPLGSGNSPVNASQGCFTPVVPASTIFNPVTNPGGIRCDIWTSLINVYGKDPGTGYARRALDNVGKQYGLQAFQNGDITLNQFLNLNVGIGGFDNSGYPIPTRTVADPAALDIAYKTGRINTGAGGIPDLPIIDAREYIDQEPEPNVHMEINGYEMRARLLATNGTYANQVMFRAQDGTKNVQLMHDAALDTMAQWLNTIKADSSSAAMPQKVINDKPAAATDACWINKARVDGLAQIGADNPCENTFPPHSSPELVAGKPLGSAIAKCQLKPVNAADYGAPSQAQIDRLNAAFPGGVCDYSKPGVGEQPLSGTNLTFGPDHPVPVKSRKLTFKLSPTKVKKTRNGRKGHSTKVTATLSSCPTVIWQRVIFQRLVKGKWKQAGSKIVTGSKCQASLTMKNFKKTTPVKVTTRAITGFKAAHPKAKKLRVKTHSG